MFDFLNWFKKKAPEVKEHDLRLEEIESWVSELEKKEFSEIYNEAERLKSDIKNHFKEVSKTAEQLKNSKVTQDMDPRLERRVLVARENLADKSDFISQRFLNENLDIKDWDGLVKFKEKIFANMQELNNVLLKHDMFVKIAFKKSLVGLSEAFRGIGLAMTELENLIETNKEGVGSLAKVLTDVKKMVDTKKLLETIKKELAEKENELSDLGKNKDLVESKINETENSDRFIKRTETEKQLTEVEKEKEELKLRFRNETGVLTKALKKYLHSYSGLIKRDKQSVLEAYASEPINGLISDKNKDILVVLEDIKGLIEKNSIDFDDKTKNKLVDFINNAPEFFEKSEKEFKRIVEIENNLKAIIENTPNEDYKDMIQTQKMSKKWISETEFKISELKKGVAEKSKEFGITKASILKRLNNQFNFKISIRD